MALELIDFVILVAYLAGLIALGIAFSRGKQTQETYFLGNRNTPWYLAGISVLATLLSTLSYLSVPGEAVRHGIGFFANLLAFVFVIPIVNRWVIPTLMRLQYTSVYEYLEHRFGRDVRSVGAVVFVVTRLIWMGLIIYTASFAVSTMTGWSTVWLIVITTIMTTLYTSIGGFRAVIWSDFAQFVILAGGAILTLVYVGSTTETNPLDWWDVFAQAGRSEVPVFSFDPTVRVTVVGAILTMLVWNICTHGADQVAAQRYLSTSSEAEARRSVWVFAVSNVSMITLLMACGMALFYYYFQQSALPLQEFQNEITKEADKVFPNFIAHVLPPGVTGLVLTALLAAAMSSLSSGINSVSSVVVVNFLSDDGQKGAVNEGVQKAVQIAVFSGILGMVLALAVNELMQRSHWNILELMERVNHLFVAPLGAMFFSGMLIGRAGAKAVLLGFAVGVATSVSISFGMELFALQKPISFTWIMPASFVLSFLTTFLASFFWPARIQHD